jgi:beta-mannosidase
MIAQTLWMKGQIEVMRSSNSYGTLIWQLNEIWPTGGWGVMEYGSQRNLRQQVIGGRWKPLMYLLRQSLFNDFIVACGEGGECYARSDGQKQVEVQVRAEAWKLSQVEPLATWMWDFELSETEPLIRFQLPQNWTSHDADAILLDVESGDGRSKKMVDTSVFLWKTPAELAHERHDALQIRCKVVNRPRGAGDRPFRHRVAVQVTSDRLALYVVLSTKAMGRFDYNAFHVRPNEPRMVNFEGIVPGEEVDVDLFESTLRVEHLLKYTLPPPDPQASHVVQLSEG